MVCRTRNCYIPFPDGRQHQSLFSRTALQWRYIEGEETYARKPKVTVPVKGSAETISTSNDDGFSGCYIGDMEDGFPLNFTDFPNVWVKTLVLWRTSEQLGFMDGSSDSSLKKCKINEHHRYPDNNPRKTLENPRYKLDMC